MDQFLFYQHNVQQYFLRHRPDYAGIVVPLSIAVSFRDGTNGFLRALFTVDPSKRFFIDPRSPLFQYGWSRDSVRPPHEKMAAALAGPFPAGLAGPLDAAALTEDRLAESVHACITFQQLFSQHEPEQKKKLDKYAALAQVAPEALPQLVDPWLLTPPYLRFISRGDAWYNASLRCTQLACQEFGAGKIQPVIHSRDGLSDADWQAIAADYHATGVGHVVFYPNDFKEHDAEAAELDSSVYAVRRLNAAGMRVMRMHGGYLAIAQEKLGLCAFGNGLGYGEWRTSGYHKGGTAEKRIYVPRLHQFLEPTVAENLILGDVEFFTEGTTILKKLIQDKVGLATIPTEVALDHFMESRRKEIAFVAQHSIAEIRADLDATVQHMDEKQQGEEGLEETYHEGLRRWSASMTTW